MKKAAAKKTVETTTASTKTVRSAKLPATKMAKTQVIRYMADQMKLPPKQVAGIFNLLIEISNG